MTRFRSSSDLARSFVEIFILPGKHRELSTLQGDFS